MTPTFKDVAKIGYVDIKTVKVVRADGTDIPKTMKDQCNGAVTIKKVDSEGAYLTTYYYYCTSKYEGWYKLVSNQPVALADGEVPLNYGEAVLVNNNYKGQEVNFQVSGEVDLVSTNLVRSGKSLYGNCTPVPVDLTQVKILREDGSAIPKTMKDQCNGAVTIKQVSQQGTYGTTYYYYCTSKLEGWYTLNANNQTVPVDEGDVPLAPGASFLVNNNYKSLPVIVKMPEIDIK